MIPGLNKVFRSC